MQEDSITIVWETENPTSNNYVEYGFNDSYGFIEQGVSNKYHHEIVIKPGFNNGHYRVVSDGIFSNDFQFKLTSYFTEEASFKCVFIGDSRGSWDDWANAEMVADAVNKESPVFVIHGGDMVDNGNVIDQWDNWLSLMMPLMQNSTIFGVLGNHENNGDRYYEIFCLPNNEKWYSFDYGPCHFVILNDYEPWGLNSDQYQWLENDLKITNSLFRVVCFHEPIYCSGGHSPRNDIKKVWEPLFIKYGVKLVLQSHCHYYQRSNKIEDIIYVVSGGAGAPLYSPDEAWFVNISKKCYHYTLLEYNSDSNRLKFSAHNLDGSVFDEFYVDSSNAPSPPVISGPSKGDPFKEYEFNIKAYDPNDDVIYLLVDWGDGSDTGWIGPIDSGVEINLNHSWDSEDIYNIKAKAKDDPNGDGNLSDGIESGWGYFEINLPKNFLLNRFLIRFTNYFTKLGFKYMLIRF